MVVVGIDLGTTYSSVAVFKDGSVYVIPDETGSRLIPSIVAFTEKEILVGSKAKSVAYKYPKDTIYDSKRFIGQKFDDDHAQKDASNSLYEVVNKNGYPHVKITSKNLVVSIEDITVHILKKLKNLVENVLQCFVTDAVITVPAHFNNARRSATKKAAETAGFRTVRIINEPTAAAIASQYKSKKTHQRKILVCDFGGGTFDASIVSVHGHHFTVIVSDGDCYLGGKDVDANIMTYLEKVIEDHHGKHSVRFLNRLKNACEEAKKNLSFSGEYAIDLPGIIEDCVITRSQFEQMNEELFQRTLIIVENCLKAAGFVANDIDELVLVGGSCRIPRVQQLLKNKFPKSAMNVSVNPDEAIAFGAAVYGGKIDGDKIELDIQDILTLSLGVRNWGDVMCFMMQKNAKLPCSYTGIVKTVQHFQTTLKFLVYQGESLIASRNKLLGRFNVTNMRKERRGVVKVQVTFNVNEEGLLKVTAVESDTDNSSELTVTLTYGILPVLEGNQTDQMAFATDEELQYVQFIKKRNAFLKLYQDFQLDHEHKLENRDDILQAMKTVKNRCKSIKPHEELVIEDLTHEMESLMKQIQM